MVYQQSSQPSRCQSYLFFYFCLVSIPAPRWLICMRGSLLHKIHNWRIFISGCLRYGEDNKPGLHCWLPLYRSNLELAYELTFLHHVEHHKVLQQRQVCVPHLLKTLLMKMKHTITSSQPHQDEYLIVMHGALLGHHNFELVIVINPEACNTFKSISTITLRSNVSYLLFRNTLQ